VWKDPLSRKTARSSELLRQATSSRDGILEISSLGVAEEVRSRVAGGRRRRRRLVILVPGSWESIKSSEGSITLVHLLRPAAKEADDDERRGDQDAKEQNHCCSPEGRENRKENPAMSAPEDVTEWLEARARYVQLEPGAGEEDVEKATNDLVVEEVVVGNHGTEVDEDSSEEVAREARSRDVVMVAGVEQAADTPGREGEEAEAQLVAAEEQDVHEHKAQGEADGGEE
jgi:hypothetical protein